MELGKGYAFVARQQHIHTEKQDYYIDLVFYNYILKAFVLIDCKTSKVTHQDVGQMDMYIRMYDELKRTEHDNPTIGKKKEYQIARIEQIEQIRRTEYSFYRDVLQQMINESNRDNFLLLQKSTNRLLLFAGPELSTIINEYYNTIINNANAGKPTLNHEHISYQTKIVNAMRSELGVSTIELDQVRFIGAPLQ